MYVVRSPVDDLQRRSALRKSPPRTVGMYLHGAQPCPVQQAALSKGDSVHDTKCDST